MLLFYDGLRGGHVCTLHKASYSPRPQDRGVCTKDWDHNRQRMREAALSVTQKPRSQDRGVCTKSWDHNRQHMQEAGLAATQKPLQQIPSNLFSPHSNSVTIRRP